MKKSSRTRFISEVEATATEVTARRPFMVERDKRRRFVRLELSAPMSLHTIKDVVEGFRHEEDRYAIQGLILNISAGGVLVEIGEVINEGDVVSMRFTLQEVETLDNVLGLVKRVEVDSEGVLVGIEFISIRDLEDMFTKGEMDLLAGKYANFDDTVQNVLSKYIGRQKAFDVVK